MNDFKIVIGSPIEYEELTADIVFDGKYIARVQKEEGNDKMKLEFFEILSFEHKIYLKSFIEALKDAEKLLLK